jgi:hypothetical protein
VLSLTCSLVYGLGLQPAGVIHNNLAGYIHHLLFFYVRTTTQPSIKVVSLCHKKVGRFCFTESRVFRYKSFVLVHGARFYSECYTIKKGCNKICVNNSFLPMNIQYLKILARNWKTHKQNDKNKRWQTASKCEILAPTLTFTSRIKAWLPNSQITNWPWIRVADLQGIWCDRIKLAPHTTDAYIEHKIPKVVSTGLRFYEHGLPIIASCRVHSLYSNWGIVQAVRPVVGIEV